MEKRAAINHPIPESADGATLSLGMPVPGGGKTA
jgi:hypothetical protein